jgi:hypothetical protein
MVVGNAIFRSGGMPNWEGVLGALLVSPLGAAGLTAQAAWKRRREAAHTEGLSGTELASLSRTFRTGEPPIEPALDATALALLPFRRKSARVLRAEPLLGAVLVPVSLVAALITGNPLWFAGALLGVALYATIPWYSRRIVTKLDRLEAVLQNRSPAPRNAQPSI